MSFFEDVKKKIESLGNVNVSQTTVDKIVFDTVFRDMCESNGCGNYGRNYTCPPHCGEIDDMIANAKTFDTILVYQTISPLEDSYDYEGMMAAGKKHGVLSDEINDFLLNSGSGNYLHLGAGGCRVCETCGVQTGEPCRHPNKALTSLEATGISVSQLAESCAMKYINGENTVTYFGAILFRGA